MLGGMAGRWSVRSKATKLDTVFMVAATDRAANYTQDTIKRAERLRDDPDRAERVAAAQCRWCFYAAGRAGGAAITYKPCAGCKTVMLFGSTNTDVLCTACATEHKLCKHCGGDSEMRPMRRKWPTFAPVAVGGEDE